MTQPTTQSNKDSAAAPQPASTTSDTTEAAPQRVPTEPDNPAVTSQRHVSSVPNDSAATPQQQSDTTEASDSAAPQRQRTATAFTEGGGVVKKTILVVDDNEINRQILQGLIKDDYDVLEARDGQEALLTLSENHKRVSAVLLDLVMPVADGFAVLKAMGENPELSQIPVIVITGDTDKKTEQKALTLGANDFVTKPFDVDIIKRRLENLIKLRDTASMVNALQKDRLTGIWNREAFFERAGWEIQGNPSGTFMLGCVDIDNFKLINDQYGTEKGDEVICALADVLKDSCNVSGGVGICGRISADNFVLLFPLTTLEAIPIGPNYLADCMLERTGMPITMSVGCCAVDDKSLGVNALYDRAKIALHSIKGRYDARAALFDESMRERIVHEQNIVSEMGTALAEDQFEPWFQPQYNHATGALIGAEALARWRHPTRGLIPPGEFIPIFERNGFVYELDKSIWSQTCACLRRWIDEGRRPLPISVNISRYDLLRADLTHTLMELLETYELPVDILRLEVTESAFAESADQIVDVVQGLIEQGFTIEIDDFGSGYSSLNTLKDIPAQIVKLDMRFLENSNNLDRGGNILESVVRMCKWLGMSVIAEGVEEVEQADFLKSIGCNYVQGYLYARPLPVADYEVLCSGADKEEHLIKLETVENLDNNSFWDPQSMDSLIFNSYIGAACIFEYHNGTIELVRATEKYTKVISNGNMSVEDALELDWSAHLDEENGEKVLAAIERSVTSGEEVTEEYVFTGLPGCPEKTCLRSTLRVIATAGSRSLVYCTNENITTQREAERAQYEADERLRFLNEVSKELLAQSDIEASINDVLGKILDYFGADRAVLFEQGTGQVSDATHETCAPGVRAVHGEGDGAAGGAGGGAGGGDSGAGSSAGGGGNGDDNGALQEMSARRFERWAQIFKENGIILIEDAAALSEGRSAESDTGGAGGIGDEDGVRDTGSADGEHGGGTEHATRAGDATRGERSKHGGRAERGGRAEQALLDTQDVRSLIAVPLYRNRELTGFISLDNPTRHLEQTEQLRALGDYIAVMLARRDFIAKVENDSALLQTLMDDMPGGFARIRLQPDGTLSTEYVNEAFCRMRQMTFDEIISSGADNALMVIHPDDREAAHALLKQVLVTGGKDSITYRVLRGDGSYIPLKVFGNTTKTETGEVFVNLYYTELSEQERKDYTLTEMVPFILSAIMESSNDYAFAKDKDFRYISCSPAFLRLAGLTDKAEVVGKTDFELFSEDMARQFRTNDIELFESDRPLIDYSETVHTDDGEEHYCRASKHILRDSTGEIIGLYGASRDITAEHNAFERLKLLTDSIPGGIATYTLSPEGIEISFYNDGFCKLLGCTREHYEEYSAHNGVMSHVFEKDMPRLMEQIEALAEHGTPVDCNYRSEKFDGSGYIWINLRGVLSERRGTTCVVNAVLYDVTKEHAANERLRVSEAEYRLAIEGSDRYIYRYNHESESIDLSERVASLLGLPTHLDNVPESLLAGGLVAEEDASVYREFYHAITCGDESGTMTIRRKVSGGIWRWFSVYFRNIYGDEGYPVSAIIVFHDVTDQREKEAAYRRWKQSIEKLSSENYTLFRWNISRDVPIGSLEGSLLRFETAPTSKFNENTLRYAAQHVYPEDRERYIAFVNADEMFASYHRGLRFDTLEYRDVLPDGRTRWLRLTVELVEYPDSTDVCAYLVYEDIDEAKREELRVHEMAETDPLTGVLNRAAFAAGTMRLRDAPSSGVQYALLMLDIDGFKLLNDTFGHAAGDAALIEVADTLRSVLRHGDLLGRLGGDEFLIALKDIGDDTNITKKAQHICTLLRKNHNLGVQTSASIGIAVCPRDGEDFDTLYNKADTALYSVKESGKGRCAFYLPEMEKTSARIENT